MTNQSIPRAMKTVKLGFAVEVRKMNGGVRRHGDSLTETVNNDIEFEDNRLRGFLRGSRWSCGD